jgi:hypothetical protein
VTVLGVCGTKGAKEAELTNLNSEATVRQSVERQRDEVRGT